MQKNLEPDYTPNIFNNIDHSEFVGMWDGKEYPIAANSSQHFPAFLVEAFAGQLVDKIILRDFKNSFGDVAKRDSIKSRIVNSHVENTNDGPVAFTSSVKPVEEVVESAPEEVEEVEDKPVTSVSTAPTLSEKPIRTTKSNNPKLVQGFEGQPK